MATVEDIISMVLIISVFIVASILFVNQYSRIVMAKERYWGQFELEDKYSSTLNALLEVTEANSRRTFGDLMGSAAYYRTNTLRTKHGQVDVEERFQLLLDRSFPAKNYYFEVAPIVEAFHLVFFVDGSNSTKDESEYLAKNMEFILRDLNSSAELRAILPDYEVSASVYILNIPNSSFCLNYTYSAVPCEYLTYDYFYFNQTYTAWDMKKYKYKLFQPPHFDQEMDVWLSDWETAMSAVALHKPNTNLGVVTIFLPIAGQPARRNPVPVSLSCRLCLRNRLEGQRDPRAAQRCRRSDLLLQYRPCALLRQEGDGAHAGAAPGHQWDHYHQP